MTSTSTTRLSTSTGPTTPSPQGNDVYKLVFLLYAHFNSNISKILLNYVSLKFTDLTECSAFSASECSWETDPHNEGDIDDQIEGVKNIEECQFYCRSVYDETCKYFIYGTTTKICFIFNHDDHLCTQTGGSIQVNATECNQVFSDRIDIHDCSVS